METSDWTQTQQQLLDQNAVEVTYGGDDWSRFAYVVDYGDNDFLVWSNYASDELYRPNPDRIIHSREEAMLEANRQMCR